MAKRAERKWNECVDWFPGMSRQSCEYVEYTALTAHAQRCWNKRKPRRKVIPLSRDELWPKWYCDLHDPLAIQQRELRKDLQKFEKMTGKHYRFVRRLVKQHIAIMAELAETKQVYAWAWECFRNPNIHTLPPDPLFTLKKCERAAVVAKGAENADE